MLLARPLSRVCSCSILPRIHGPISRFPDSALTLLVSQGRTTDFISATTPLLPEPPEAARYHGGCVYSRGVALTGFPSQQWQRTRFSKATSVAVSRGHALSGWDEGGPGGGVRPGGGQRLGSKHRFTWSPPAWLPDLRNLAVQEAASQGPLLLC